MRWPLLSLDSSGTAADDTRARHVSAREDLPTGTGRRGARLASHATHALPRRVMAESTAPHDARFLQRPQRMRDRHHTLRTRTAIPRRSLPLVRARALGRPLPVARFSGSAFEPPSLTNTATAVAIDTRIETEATASLEATVAVDTVVPTPSATTQQTTLRRQVLSLALPAIGEQVLALGVGLSDTFLSGHLSTYAMNTVGYDRATAVAAVGAASTVVWVILNVFFAVNIGVTALVARATGAKDGAMGERAAAQGIILGFVFGLAMIALSIPAASLVIALLGITGQVATLATQYIRILSLALPFTGMASAATASMRGAGDARRPVLVMMVVNGLNICASWTLLNGLPALHIPAFGVLGSAIGAATGWALGCVLAVTLLSRRHPKAPKLVRAALHFDRAMATRILRIGLPSAAELVVFQVGVLTFSRFVVGLGDASYAANVTINTVESLATLPGFGFAVAATALVGQSLGANDPERAVRAAVTSFKYCLLLMGVIGVLALLVPQVMLSLFVADPQVLAAGAFAMRFSFLTLPASAVAFVFNGALRGAGDTKFPVFVRAVGTWGLRVPLALILIPLWALPGARLAQALDWGAQAGITYWRFRSGKWRLTKV